ncbi:MAG: FKBP-type peptidyl-prolyl cis-trans isomerase [Nevskia sp.]|nr:FKBP-type peptidyl-prolyl cis-trans isomerase [Nevskia sp.]
MLKPTRLAFVCACALAAAACNKQAGTTDAAKPADAPASPPAADLVTDGQKFSYAVGYNVGHNIAAQTPKENLDLKALEQGIEEGAAGKMDAAKLSYTIGSNVGKNLSNQVPKDDFDIKALKQGIEEAATGLPARIDEKGRQDLMMAERTKIQQKAAADQAALAKKNKDEGDKFLADNGKKPNVKTTASGLQYEVETEGSGDHPGPTDSVTVNYKGTLLDGTVFDSSYDRKQPATFRVDQVIKGWSEGVQLMAPGGKYKFYVPSALGYGDNSPTPKIPAGSTLVFEVELISVQKTPPPAAPAPAAPAKKK